MKIDCPDCGANADLVVEVFAEDQQFDNPENDWRISCGNCGSDLEGEVSFLHRAVLLFLFLFPIAVCWGLFMLYSEMPGGGWLQFVVFLIHLAFGLITGTWFSTKYGKWIVTRRQ